LRPLGPSGLQEAPPGDGDLYHRESEENREQGLVPEARNHPSGDQREAEDRPFEEQSIEAVKQCVAAGMGVSVLISVAVEAEIEDGKLAALRWEEPFEVFTQMVWHEKRWKSPALRAFLETAREVFVR
jgi:DNA-binding transcriptional LysR family regulator